MRSRLDRADRWVSRHRFGLAQATLLLLVLSIPTILLGSAVGRRSLVVVGFAFFWVAVFALLWVARHSTGTPGGGSPS